MLTRWSAQQSNGLVGKGRGRGVSSERSLTPIFCLLALERIDSEPAAMLLGKFSKKNFSAAGGRRLHLSTAVWFPLLGRALFVRELGVHGRTGK